MKKRKIILIITIMFLTFIIGISINFALYKNKTIIREKEVIQGMNESTQISDLQTQINNLNIEHLNYTNYIQECKTKIANAITNVGIETSTDANCDTIIENIGKISKSANDVSQWCEIAGIDYDANYGGLETLLTSQEAMETIMKNSEAVNYLNNSDLLMLCILSYKESTQALVRNVDLNMLKTSEEWRNAIAKSNIAKEAIFECSDVIKSISVSKNISTTSSGGKGCSTSGTVNFTITDPNMLVIKTAISTSGSGYSYSNSYTDIYINNEKILRSSASGSGLNVTNSLNHSNSTYPAFASKATSAYAYLYIKACGTCNNNSTATIYYI